MTRLPPVLRAFVCVTLATAATLAWTSLWATQASADTPPDPLRQQLEQARTHSTLPASVFDSISLQLDIAGRIRKGFPTQAEAYRGRATRWLKTAEQGRDPVLDAQGQIVMRGYQSPLSQVMQGYAVYLPKNYDPKRAYPLMVVLHGGSANGNLFLGVVLGNNMNWKEYDQHLWDEFTPRYEPDWIVVAPDGFGHVMWRFMGEQDVLDVVSDVQKHYRVDADRTVLMGLSNGGVGAYMLGMRYASRFSAVLAVAGAPSWSMYAGAGIDKLQTEELQPVSAMSLAENAINTDFRYFHGHVDPGPMRPAYVEAFGKHIATLGVPYKEKWFDTGHDLLYLVVRQGAMFKDLQNVTRNRHPTEVRLVSGDYRAAEQHWLRLTRIDRLPELARVRAVAQDSDIVVETQRASALEITWHDVPLAAGDKLRVRIDGQTIYDAARSGSKEVLQFVRDERGWHLGTPASVSAGTFSKQPGSAGPITDAYYRSLLHVYGTQDPAQTEALRKTAERGAHGWPLWLWRLEQRVIADTDVTPELMQQHDLALYGTPGSNAILEKIKGQLPVRIDADAVVLGGQSYRGRGVGTKFIHPNPLAPTHYVLVHTAPTIEGVQGAHNLPDFLPDYVVYDAKVTRSRPRLTFGSLPLAMGYFDNAWHFDAKHTRESTARAALERGPVTPTLARRAGRQPINEGNGPESADHDNPKSPLPVPPPPATPPLPMAYATEGTTQAGKAAREIARRVGTFLNYRIKIAGATWLEDKSVSWSIREADICLGELSEHGVSAEPWTKSLATPVATPVKVTAAVDGVTFRFLHAGAGAVVSCELAARLRDIAAVVAKYGVHTVHVMSAYRDHPYTSFHTLGLALDLSRFDTDDGPLIVQSDFTIDRAHETCAEAAKSPNEKHRKLHAIACDLAATRRFSSVLTPNYNAGHRDHFHVDVRPDDPRLFTR